MVDISTLLIAGLLVGVMVAAFKLMQIVFQTFLAAVVSSLFYIGIVTFTGTNFSINGMLVYSFFGALLYLVFSIGASAYGILNSLLSIPYKLIIFIVWKPSLYVYSMLKESDSIQKRIDNGGGQKGNEGLKDDEIKDKILEKTGRK